MIGLLAVVAAAACSARPSLRESGALLAEDGKAVMAWKYWLDERITNSATSDVSCGDGRSKRVFTATGQSATLTPDPDTKLDVTTGLVGASLSERGYARDFSGPDQSDVIDSRTIVWVNEAAGLRFSVTMTLPSETRIAVQINGETECQ